MAELQRIFGRLLNSLALIAIALYRAVGSLWLSGSCRFEPSCSVYAQEALEQHGFWVGSKLALARLGKCRPGGAFGYDPVPRAQANTTGGNGEVKANV